MPTASQRRATAADVARLSGVSRATVSYVLNRTAGQTIPESTRNRVLRAADDLGYIPSASAQALARGRSNLVVIDISDVPLSEVLSNLAHDLAEVFRNRGYVPIVDQLTRGEGDRSLLKSLSLSVVPDVVITMTDLPADIQDTLLRAGVRHLASLSPADSPWSLERQIRGAASVQLDYLIARGHRDIAYLGPRETELATLSAWREAAAHATATAHGARLRTATLPHGLDDSATLVSELREAGVTALAAYNDDVALRLIHAAHRAHLRLPGDLAIMGIDDVAAAAWSHPQLTTVNQVSPEDLPVEARVDRLLAGDSCNPPEGPSPRVVVRETA
ncbi:LacI family DNA-binding transcriptional regulator [Micrococcales bacterium 31B]|nr:LacI family DNA-binding transcriptional regulator [Micrococcales bacterium 31B]